METKEIKELITISKLLNSRYGIDTEGKTRIPSPIHSTNDANFTFDDDKGVFNCFSQEDERGDIFKLVQLMEGVDFKTSKDIIENHFNLNKLSKFEHDKFMNENKIIKKQNIEAKETRKVSPDYFMNLYSKMNSPTTNNKYLKDKKIQNYICDVAKETNKILYIPMQNNAGEITGLQRIFENRDKPNVPGSAIVGSYCKLKGKDDKEILICEGYSTAVSLKMATNKSIVITFGIGNMEAVYKNIREKYPDSDICLCPDNDEKGEKLKEKFDNEYKNDKKSILILPNFQKEYEGKKIKDYNDIHCAVGLKKVKEVFEKSLTQELKVKEWKNTIDRYLSNDIERSKPIQISENTPLVMELVGAKNLPIEINISTINKVLKDHDLPIDILKQVPKALEEPIFIFDSDSNDNIVLALDLKDKQGATVVVPIMLDKTSNRGYEVNHITSIYGRRHTRNKANTNEPNYEWFIDQIEKGNLKYIDQKKSQAWIKPNGLYLPTKLNRLDNENIYTFEDLVKLKEERSRNMQTNDPKEPIVPKKELTENVKSRTYLEIKDYDAELVKERGAVFDSTKKAYYIPENKNPKDFQEWLNKDLAKEIYADAVVFDNHSYLTEKNIGVNTNSNIKVNNLNEIIVPFTNSSNEIRAIQYLSQIKNEGTEETKTLKNRGDVGLFHKIGADLNNDTKEILICEGYTNGASLHQTTKQPVLVALDNHNLGIVTDEIAKKYPNSQIILCANNDHENEKRKLNKAIKLSSKLDNCICVYPEFKEINNKGKCSFNDLITKESGLSQIQNQFESAKAEAIIEKVSKTQKKSKGVER